MKKRTLSLLLFVLLAVACAAPAMLPSPTIIETGVEPDTWAKVPSGEFLMGIHMHRSYLDQDIEMMETPVTNAQFADYLNAALPAGTVKLDRNAVVGYYPGDPFHGHNHEKEIAAGDWLHLPLDDPNARIVFDGERFDATPGYENHPAVLVTWFGAQGYCDYYDWRLPTEAEWEKAARGEDGRAYPWGDEITEQHANFYNSKDPFETGIGALGDTTPIGFYNGAVNGGFETVAAISPYGLYDMAGNVWEWTADIHEGMHDRYLKGGSKANYAYDLRAWTRNSAPPDYVSVGAGFRCARDISP